MVSDQLANEFLELCKKRGFGGFSPSSGKYLVNGLRVSSSRLIATLGLPDCIIQDESASKELLREIFLKRNLKELSVFVESILSKDVNQNNKPTHSEVLDELMENREERDKQRSSLVFALALNKGLNQNDRYVAINSKSRSVIRGLDAEALAMSLGLNIKECIFETKLSCTLEFNPRTSEFIYEKEYDGYVTKVANLYVPPKWMELDVEPVLDGYIHKLIYHLFPDPVDRELAIDWLSYALADRNQTILVLVGKRGIGKNALMDIMSDVIGTDYYATVGQAMLEEKFNANMYNKRLITLDEVRLSSLASQENLKRLANDVISIEKKGVDAFTAINFCSIAIMTNNITNLKILPQDRRYSIPRVTELDLTTSIPREEIQHFKKQAEDKTDWYMEQIAKFGKFLLERKPKLQQGQAIKNEYFHYITSANLPAWFHHFFEYMEEFGEADTPVAIKEIFKNYQYAKVEPPPSTYKALERSLGDFKFRGLYVPGKVMYVYDTRKGLQVPAFAPSSEFLKALAEERKERIARGEMQPPEQDEESDIDLV